jgi:hypothetical protein
VSRVRCCLAKTPEANDQLLVFEGRYIAGDAPDARDGPAAVDVAGAAVTDADVFPRRPARRHTRRVRGI